MRRSRRERSPAAVSASASTSREPAPEVDLLVDRPGRQAQPVAAGCLDHRGIERAMIDPYTLESARILVSRGVQVPEPAIRCETLQTSVREIKKLSEVA